MDFRIFKGENKMSLYKNWTDMVVEYVKVKGQNAFGKNMALFKEVYTAVCFTVIHINSKV